MPLAKELRTSSIPAGVASGAVLRVSSCHSGLAPICAMIAFSLTRVAASSAMNPSSPRVISPAPRVDDGTGASWLACTNSCTMPETTSAGDVTSTSMPDCRATKLGSDRRVGVKEKIQRGRLRRPAFPREKFPFDGGGRREKAVRSAQHANHIFGIHARLGFGA